MYKKQRKKKKNPFRLELRIECSSLDKIYAFPIALGRYKDIYVYKFIPLGKKKNERRGRLK